MLCHTLIPLLARHEYEVVGIDVQEVDITDKKAIITEIARQKPAFVVHTAAMTAVDTCEDHKDTAMAVNRHGAANVAEGAAEIGVPVILISTDYVFNGRSPEPYLEDDPADPISVYGESKALGEIDVKAVNPKHFILRTSWLYGSGGKNFVDTIIRLASDRDEIKVVNDQVGSPTYTGHLSAAIERVVGSYIKEGGEDYGIYHATNAGKCSWYDFARLILEKTGNTRTKVLPMDSEELFRIMNYKAPRPAFSVLSHEKLNNIMGFFMPDWRAGLDEYLAEKR